MHNKTGSVYLDAPRPGRSRTPSPRRQRRTTVAALAAMIGMLGLTVAGLLAAFQSIASDTGPLVEAIDTTISDPDSRAEVEADLAAAIRTGLLGSRFTEAAELWGVDVEGETGRWAAAVLDDDRFAAALADLVTELHSRIFVEPVSGPVDTSELTAIVIAAADESAPGVAPFLPTEARLITIDGADLPDLTGPTTFVDRAILVALASGAALPLALLIHDRRHDVLSWAGRWLLAVGLGLAVTAVGLPYMAGLVTGWTTAETATRALSLPLLVPAGLAGIVGMGLVTVAAVARRREERRLASEGAAAWLDVIEPAPIGAAASPSHDLGRRGLVDGGRQLTSS